MPWDIVKRGRKYAVVKRSTGEVEGEHDTWKDAVAQLRGLDAGERGGGPRERVGDREGRDSCAGRGRRRVGRRRALGRQRRGEWARLRGAPSGAAGVPAAYLRPRPADGRRDRAHSKEVGGARGRPVRPRGVDRRGTPGVRWGLAARPRARGDRGGSPGEAPEAQDAAAA